MSLHRYTSEFKRKVIDLHEKGGRTYKSIADEYGVSKTSISKWCSEYKKEYQKKLRRVKARLAKENSRLKRENKKLRRKIAFLKKTTLFFVKEIN